MDDLNNYSETRQTGMIVPPLANKPKVSKVTLTT
jgi:hypothetical protein